MHLAAIDFGTSNSTVGIIHQGEPLLLRPQSQHQAVPTALFFPPQGRVLAGYDAIEAYIEGEQGRFLRGLKSVLGTELFTETTLLQRKHMGFAEIIATYLKWLINTAEQAYNHPITHLMLGRPVHFLTNNPAADTIAENQLRTIAQQHLGIANVEFLAEPLAAAHHYQSTLQQAETTLIVDIGGGTADLSVLHLTPNSTQQSILATHGLRLGGTDIDHHFAMANTMPHLGLGTEIAGPMGGKGLTVPRTYYTQLSTWHRIHRMYEKSTLAEVKGVLAEALEPTKVARLLELLEQHGGHRLMFAVEAAKIELSHQQTSTLNLSWLEKKLEIPLTHTQLANSIEEWLHTLQISIQHTLQLANIKPENLHTLFLTGGPSAMPLVRQAVQTIMPQTKVIQGNQLTSVGHGLIRAAQTSFLKS